MAQQLIDNLRALQKYIREQGLGATLISVQESKLMLDSETGPESNSHMSIFSQLIDLNDIVEVSRDLFQSGFFSQAVDEAIKVLENIVRSRSQILGKSGEELIRQALSPDEPLLVWSDQNEQWQKDEQKGYFYLVSGCSIGIGSPIRSNIGSINDPETAIEIMAFVQHLIKKISAATKVAPPSKYVL